MGIKRQKGENPIKIIRWEDHSLRCASGTVEQVREVAESDPRTKKMRYVIIK